MKVILVSYFNRFEEYPTKYSLGTLRIAAYLANNKETDISIIPYDLDVQTSMEDVVKQIEKEGPDVVGLPAYIWTWETTLALCNSLSDSQILFVIGGPEVQNHPNAKPDKNKIFISGDGELFWDYLIKQMLNGVSREHLLATRNIANHQKINCYYKADGQIDLAYRLPVFSNRFFNLVKHIEPPNEFIWYETSRGCSFRCGYCGHKNREGVALFDASFIEKEIKYIGEQGIKRMFVVDPIIGGNKKNGKHFFVLLGKYAPKTKIIAYLRPEFIDDEYIELLAGVSVEEIRIGIQTLNPQVPKWIRNNNLNAIINKLPKLTQKGIPWRAELIVGLPGDDPAGFIHSLRFVINELHPTYLYAYHLSVLKETPLFSLKDAEGELWIKTDENGVSAESSYSYSKTDMIRMLDIAKIVNLEYNKKVIWSNNGTYNSNESFESFAKIYLDGLL